MNESEKRKNYARKTTYDPRIILSIRGNLCAFSFVDAIKRDVRSWRNKQHVSEAI